MPQSHWCKKKKRIKPFMAFQNKWPRAFKPTLTNALSVFLTEDIVVSHDETVLQYI